jgi:pimeloyl-ACP methyl ester carboxylesterase
MRMASERTPAARFHVFEHAGHAPFLTHAADVARCLRDFLA